jgi:integrase
MATKRIRKDSIEYVLTNKKMLSFLNPQGKKSITYPLDQEALADKQIHIWDSQLKAGILPDFLKTTVRNSNRTLTHAVYEYIEAVHCKPADVEMLKKFLTWYGQTLLSEINFKWVNDYVSFLKRERNVAPSTVRKYVGALSRCLNWNINMEFMKDNPITRLPDGYSMYTKTDEKFAPKKIDISRERRLSPDGKEEQSIREILQGKGEGNKRIEIRFRAAYEFMFILALESCMRMREIYTLRFIDIDVSKRTISLKLTKNGKPRQVPMTTPAIKAYEVYLKHIEDGTSGMDFKPYPDHVFPFWNGDMDRDYLKGLTSRIGHKFAGIFKLAGLVDFKFHDLRHEATSRLFEKSNLNSMQIMQITGHSDHAMLNRYTNLRASDLAVKLW